MFLTSYERAGTLWTGLLPMGLDNILLSRSLRILSAFRSPTTLSLDWRRHGWPSRLRCRHPRMRHRAGGGRVELRRFLCWGHACHHHQRSVLLPNKREWLEEIRRSGSGSKRQTARRRMTARAPSLPHALILRERHTAGSAANPNPPPSNRPPHLRSCLRQ